MNGNSFVEITHFSTLSGKKYGYIRLYYQVFGQNLGEAPLIVVNHALTGNSQLIGENGWWNEAVGVGKSIDTQRFSVLCFDIPGNGYNTPKEAFIHDYKEWTARDVARIFLEGLKKLKISNAFALVGNSVGGGIAWEMLVLAPDFFEHFFAIATDWKSTDWIIANCLIQEVLLEKSNRPLHDARLHAMLCYRSPASFTMKFNRTMHSEKPLHNVETWLLHHGEKLENRFYIESYQLMNQLVKSIDISKGRHSFEEAIAPILTEIHLIATNSDLYFVPEENRKTYEILLKKNKKCSYDEIQSIHGHDAFLIEYEQLNQIINQYICYENT